ncbi:MAG: [FeFe] hydrogenase H-cluster radical SAM maturase HydG, partial [Candidatus Omnitrophica bacterium]|nr:[FeFe] hydrogenase H-cluster radical SAM maturase HydG [Candidatus Omnitrophota bacterium]
MELNKFDSWVKDRIKNEEIVKYQDKGKDFIPEQEIISKLDLNSKKEPDPLRIKDILLKSLAIQTLTPDETAVLLNVRDSHMLEEMMKTALEVKKKVYDNRIVTFAPLYLNNLCVNNCMYCGFRKDNKTIKRKILSLEEVKKEVEVLAGKIGHKRL